MSGTPATSPTTPSVIDALSAVMADVQAVRKGDRNEQQGFNFRGIDAVVNAVGPALRRHRVIVVPELEHIDRGTVEVGNGDRRRAIGHVVLTVRYRFIGPAGDELAALVPGEAMDSGDKAFSKAMSVAYRTALLQALCIPTDEPDPDTQVYERSPARLAPPPPDAIRLMLVEAARAGVDEEAARAAAAQRHGGLVLEELDRDALRSEWAHWHELAAAAGQERADEQKVSGSRASDPAAAGRVATRRQLTKLATQLGKLGVDARAQRLHVVGRIIDRPITTTTELTGPEARDAIDALEAVLANADPPASLAAIIGTEPNP